MIKKGNIYEVTVENLDYKGDGVANFHDRFVFIPGALPNEVVIIKIIAIKQKIAFATLLQVIEPSTQRVSETSNLGSLNMLHLSFEEQLNWQSRITKETFDKVFRKDFILEDIITDNVEFNYRNKVVFHVLEEQNITLGLYETNSKNLVRVNDFKLATIKANEIIKLINNSNIKIDYKKLKHVMIKNNSNNEYLVTLISHNRSFKGKDDLIELLETLDFVKGITLNIKDNDEVIIGKKTYVLSGVNLLEEKDLLITDQSFMQVNYGVMNKTYEKIAKHVKGNRIIDAYSGIGSIGYSILKVQSNITMIENNLANIELAKKIKEDKGYDNVEIIHDNAENIIDNLNADTIIVDPPKQGLKESFIDVILKEQPKELIYLSCNLQTLVRDIRFLIEDYEITNIYPIKMFPQTNSFETLVILNKK